MNNKWFKLLGEHESEFLTGFGIAEMFCGGVMAVGATKNALAAIDAEKEKLGKEKLTVIETVKVTWKYYIPAVIAGTTGAVCIIKGYSINAKRTAALATALSITDNAYREYRDKVVEVIGTEKEQEVLDKVAQDTKKPDICDAGVVPYRGGEVVVTSDDSQLCYDTAFGRYFMSSKNRIKAAENEINRRLLSEDRVSLNEFYDELGLPPVDMGDELGWSASRDGFVDILIGHWLSEDGRPCIAISYRVSPRIDYNRYW